MRRSFVILAAAAIAVGASAVSLSSAGTAAPRPAQATIGTDGSAIIQVDWESREWGHGGGHNAFRDDRNDNWNNGWSNRRHNRFRNSRFRRDPFYFGFPFAFRPQYYPYRRRGDCFRTWDGYIVCR